MTPSYPDCAWGEYSYGVGSNSNPLASFNNQSYDTDFCPRGGYKLEFLQIDRYVGGVFADNSPISTDPLTNTWKIFIKVQLTEPFLALSPFINMTPNCCAGLVGVNNMSMVLNVDSSCKRLFSTANNAVNIGGNGLTGYISGIALGWADAPNGGASQAVGFANTRLLFNFLSLQPEQYAKISTKNVVPYLDYPRYLTTFSSGTTIASGATQTLTSQSLQLNQVPDLILICARVPMSSQNQNYTSSFLAINGISVNFNNASGLLSTATQQDLYNISYANGSSQTFHEFRGFADVNNNNTGGVTQVPTTGGLLVLSPVYNFSLPSYLSASSLGQYQFQFNLSVTNQYDFAISQPEICIITMNSGIFATQQGTSQIFTGILTKEQVLRTKEQNPQSALSSTEYQRLVGGQMGNLGMGNVMDMVKKFSGMLPSQIKDVMKQFGIGGAHSGGAMSAGASSGGAMSGGAISMGGKSKSKLAKHLA
jgi:hypothetical protein